MAGRQTTAIDRASRWEGEAPAEPTLGEPELYRLGGTCPMTLQEEFLALLRQHGIEYDPQHVWD